MPFLSPTALAGSTVGDELGGVPECDVRLEMAKVEAAARSRGLSVPGVTASILIHQHEHCIGDPEVGELHPIDAGRRLAGKLGDARRRRFAEASRSP